MGWLDTPITVRMMLWAAIEMALAIIFCAGVVSLIRPVVRWLDAIVPMPPYRPARPPRSGKGPTPPPPGRNPGSY